MFELLPIFTFMNIFIHISIVSRCAHSGYILFGMRNFCSEGIDHGYRPFHFYHLMSIKEDHSFIIQEEETSSYLDLGLDKGSS